MTVDKLLSQPQPTIAEKLLSLSLSSLDTFSTSSVLGIVNQNIIFNYPVCRLAVDVISTGNVQDLRMLRVIKNLIRLSLSNDHFLSLPSKCAAPML